jgi:hypothetical protein
VGPHPRDNCRIGDRSPEGMAGAELQGDTWLKIASRQRTETLLTGIAHARLAESASLIGSPTERMDD